MSDLQFEIKKFGLDEVTDNLLEEMRDVLDLSYYNSKMFESLKQDIKEEHEVFRAYIVYDSSRVIGVAVVEDKIHKNMDYGDHIPVHLKRFAVHPQYRRQGIGKTLLDKAKSFTFVELKLHVLFGESNEAGGMNFYGREGAIFSLEAIKTYSTRNAPEENLRFFTEFVTNPKFRSFRYQVGKGIPFVFTNDNSTEEEYRNKDYKSISEIAHQIEL